jgi:hypothetical protein
VVPKPTRRPRTFEGVVSATRALELPSWAEKMALFEERKFLFSTHAFSSDSLAVKRCV